MTQTIERNMMDAAAREAVITSWNRHGDFVPDNVAYLFVSEVPAETKGVILPQVPLAAFADDYHRHCRAIREASPFTVLDPARLHSCCERKPR